MNKIAAPLQKIKDFIREFRNYQQLGKAMAEAGMNTNQKRVNKVVRTAFGVGIVGAGALGVKAHYDNKKLKEGLKKVAGTVDNMLTEQNDRNDERRLTYLRAVPYADAIVKKGGVVPGPIKRYLHLLKGRGLQSLGDQHFMNGMNDVLRKFEFANVPANVSNITEKASLEAKKIKAARIGTGVALGGIAAAGAGAGYVASHKKIAEQENREDGDPSPKPDKRAIGREVKEQTQIKKHALLAAAISAAKNYYPEVKEDKKGKRVKTADHTAKHMGIDAAIGGATAGAVAGGAVSLAQRKYNAANKAFGSAENWAHSAADRVHWSQVNPTGVQAGDIADQALKANAHLESAGAHMSKAYEMLSMNKKFVLPAVGGGAALGAGVGYLTHRMHKGKNG